MQNRNAKVLEWWSAYSRFNLACKRSTYAYPSMCSCRWRQVARGAL